ncbi:MAG: hypothetical protein KJ066_13085 [Acidobacteria bacterium]|nr:hypothetical protein [Acidobacteriota bacterium]
MSTGHMRTDDEPARAGGDRTVVDVDELIERNRYASDVRATIVEEELLPAGLLNRLELQYPQHSTLRERSPLLFEPNQRFSGVNGFRRVLTVLDRHGITLGHQAERELFIEVYRFLATSHVLNTIDWRHFETDPLFQLTFPQPGMLPADAVEAYVAAGTVEGRTRVVDTYRARTNPHDGKQLLNRPWIEGEDGQREVVAGSQHKYPQCQLLFDRTTQNCFAYCTYCFRHAQVRGDHDMFVQDDVAQLHRYLRQHPEVTDVLITGGDAAMMPAERFAAYALPILSDPSLCHIRTIRFGSRALAYEPELVLSDRFTPMLKLFRTVVDHGVQFAWMAHFSTPRELLNPSTIAAVRRLQRQGVVIRSQSPMMNHISLFQGADGRVDVDKSAQNWIDLANLMAALRIGFHSMYCARPTGEHHYFAVPLAEIERVASKVYRSLPSINRPSRYLSMTTSAGKISILGTADVHGEKVFALKFTQARNMEWLDRVFLAKYDARQKNVDLLEPFDSQAFFFRDELTAIERVLAEALSGGPAGGPLRDGFCEDRPGTE